ncbi:dCTP deaminase [Anaerotignum sp. MB30-C6]|uniref:dCTP deaminase n=1 Tax=Anaerotignum sp. MB30-C6 TaxID=3070814 RepID=UPI0027DDFDC7|nr:dCTP deaminase [Anaerotignum sp. MB30-C6]WMI80886.1 dCTP deaminase [Anaerotignum sp. MB30-C6]WMI81859.1 dCTP deaminase [Anaerotignum sp. MB30-C6]WMI81959.1 dCTP deaminase [Anaerotignum sp. MB30-C6]
MVLTDKQIREMCVEGNEKLITPFQENALQSESYDLSIGTQISVLKKEVRCIDLEKQNEIDKIYESIEIDSSGYVLSPQEYILITLKEQINLPSSLTAHIRPRTRFTRLGLIVSDQHCNSTYSGILKLGLFNATNYAIKITPNLRVAQIVFEELKEIPSEEKLYKNKENAVYQNEEHFIGAKFSDEVNKYIDEAVGILLGRRE